MAYNGQLNTFYDASQIYVSVTRPGTLQASHQTRANLALLILQFKSHIWQRPAGQFILN